MKIYVGAAVGTLACMSAFSTMAQQQPATAPPPDTYDSHLAAAKQAAGFDFTGTLARLCVVPSTSFRDGATAQDRAGWYAEPVKVFDNLYWLGTKIHSSWALTN